MANLTVNPIWPLFGVMFGGPWLAWPWHVLNAFALGSPSRWSEALLVVAGFAVNIAMTFALLFMLGLELIPEGSVPYLLIGFTVWKIGISYLLYTWQARTFGLYEYYDGVVRNGLPVLFLGYFGRSTIGSGGTIAILVLL